MITEVLLIRAWMVTAMMKVKATRQAARHDERGMSELAVAVTLTAIGVTGTIVIAGIVISKFKGSADGIPTP